METHTDGPAPVPIVGRLAELELVNEAIAEAAGGSGRIVLIEGEAGIGKTRLVGEALAEARRLGFDVLEGSADELERRRPYGALIECLATNGGSAEDEGGPAQLLDAARAERAAGFAEMPQTGFRVAEALLEWLERRSRASTVAIAMEDLQWADAGTLFVLRMVSRHLAQLPVTLVVSCRPVPRGSELAALVGALAAQRAVLLELGPLPDGEVAELARRLLGMPPGPNLISQLSAAGGNPLFVGELVAALQDEGAIDAGVAGTAEIEGLARLPRSVGPTILHRLGFLSSETLELLGLAAVLGSSFRSRDLAALVGRPTGELAGALREAIRAGILNGDEDWLAFRHDLIREALYQDVPPGVRAGLHMDIAGLLIDASAPASAVAEHLIRGASPGDGDAVALLGRAAREAAPQAPAVAVEVLERAVELSGPEDRVREGLLADLAMNLMWAGRMDDAESVAREALETGLGPDAEGQLRVTLAHALVAQGLTIDSLTELERAAASPALPDDARLRLRAWAAQVRAVAGDLAGARKLADAALIDATTAGDEFSACLALSTLAMILGFSGQAPQALPFAEEATRRADASPGREAHRFHHYVFLAATFLDLDRLAEGIEALHRGRRISEEIGAVWNLPFFHNALTALHFCAGEWDEAIADYEAAVEVADAVGAGQGLASIHGVRCLIALHRNDLELASERMAAGERLLAERGPQAFSNWMLFARAALSDAIGEEAAALRVSAETWDASVAAGALGHLYIFGPDVVRRALAAGDRRAAAEACATLDLLVDRLGAPAAAAAALRSRSMLEDDTHLALAAVDAAKTSPRPRELGLACEHAAALLGADRRVQAARLLFDEAIDLYERLGAARDIARAAARMRALGLRRGARGVRGRPDEGWESLTPAELRVAELVAEGLTNPEVAERLFISRYTVRTHVSHILSKLGARSRVEIAAQAARRRA